MHQQQLRKFSRAVSLIAGIPPFFPLQILKIQPPRRKTIAFGTDNENPAGLIPLKLRDQHFVDDKGAENMHGIVFLKAERVFSARFQMHARIVNQHVDRLINRQQMLPELDQISDMYARSAMKGIDRGAEFFALFRSEPPQTSPGFC